MYEFGKTLEILRSVELKAAERGTVEIRGGHSKGNKFNLLQIYGGTVRLVGLNFTDGAGVAGRCTSTGGYGAQGGALVITSKSSCTLHDGRTAPPAMSTDVTIENCNLYGNRALEDGRGPRVGGAVHIDAMATATFVGCRIFSNSANQGGGLSAWQKGTKVALISTQLYDNIPDDIYWQKKIEQLCSNSSTFEKITMDYEQTVQSLPSC